MTTATAAQLKSIIFAYDSLITDYHACVGAKELQYWVDCAENCIDRNVPVLALGISKRNETYKAEISETYTRLQSFIEKAQTRIKTEKRHGLHLV